MKKKLIIAAMLVALVAAFAVLAAGCGGAPGFVMNPPEDPAELVTMLEEDDWTIMDEFFEGGFGMVIAMRISGIDVDMEDYEALMEIDNSTRVAVEMVMVFYFETEAEATLAFAMQEAALRVGRDQAPSGVSIRYQIRQNGSIVSIWISTSGTWGDVQDDVFGGDWD